ncbi:hypothetical protein [Winogradskyella aurantiaca]|uniref:hypothetical protein n=1 Tax=Winogradskyella aurantiaca TaxID=2219558 RepID=UPI000E1CED88|nr:hypothetical protein [Winogradskyella aurantiaca]
MANRRDLKRDINNVLGDILDAVVLLELDKKPSKESEAIYDDAIATFDELISKVSAKDVDNKKAHFKAISAELEEKGQALIDRLNKIA